MLFEFDVMHSATTEMYAGVNVKVNFVYVTIVVTRENRKKISMKKETS